MLRRPGGRGGTTIPFYGFGNLGFSFVGLGLLEKATRAVPPGCTSYFRGGGLICPSFFMVSEILDSSLFARCSALFYVLKNAQFLTLRSGFIPFLGPPKSPDLPGFHTASPQ